MVFGYARGYRSSQAAALAAIHMVYLVPRTAVMYAHLESLSR